MHVGATHGARALIIILAVAGAVVVVLVAIELVLRRFAPIEDPYVEFKLHGTAVNQYVASEFPRNHEVFTRHSRVDGSATAAQATAKRRFTTNNVGFRGEPLARPKPSGEVRVFITGASTAECLYLDDAQAIHAVVQSQVAAQLGPGRTVKVYNSAKSHGRSYDHVAMVVHRLVHLEPDLIIFFAGLNDLIASIYGTDYLHFTQSAPRRLPAGMLARMLLTEGQIPRRLLSLLKSRPSVTPEGRPRPAPGSRTGNPPTNLSGYRENLMTIAGAARAHDVPVLFVTQPTTWNSSVDPAVQQWQTNLQGYTEEQMDAALNMFNNVVRDLPAADGLVVCDLANAIPKSTQYFYDDAQFTVAGAQLAGEMLGRSIQEHQLVTAQGHAVAN